MTITARALSAGSCLAVLAAVALGASACGSSDNNSAAPSSSASASSSPSSAPPSSTSTSAGNASPDLSKLVIAPSDIPIPGFTQKESTPVSESGATGIAVSFANADGTRQVGDTIVTLPSASATKTALDAALSTAKTQVPGATSEPAQVGDGGYLLAGTLDNKAVTVLIFQQGTAFVVMEFASASTDPVPADLVTQVGQKQAELLKAGLPS